MYKPDKVMLEFQRGSSEIDDYHAILAHEPIECHPRVYGDWGGVYLLATSERELASELVEALRGLTEHTESTEEWMESNGYDGGPDREAVKYSRAVLAKLDKGE